MKKSLLAMAALAAMSESSAAGWSRNRSDGPSGHELRALEAGGLRAYVDAADLKTANGFMQAFGNTARSTGQVALTANPTAADIIRICRITAGTEVDEILVANTDLDSNGTPTFVVSIGYEPVSASEGSLAADATYFAAAGQTILQAANEGKSYRKFTPKKFEQDVYLTMTVGTAAATFAAGTIYATAMGKAIGVK